MELLKHFTVGRQLNIGEDGQPAPRKRRRADDLPPVTPPANGFVSNNANDDSHDNSPYASGEEYSDNDTDAMDELIESRHDVTDNNNGSNPENIENIEGDGNVGHSDPSTGNTSSTDQLFKDIYVEKEVSMYLEPVSDLLAATVTKWCRLPPKRDETKNFFKECLIPQNVEGLKPVLINAPLHKILPKHAKVSDQKLRGITTFLSRTLGPIVKTFRVIVFS